MLWHIYHSIYNSIRSWGLPLKWIPSWAGHWTPFPSVCCLLSIFIPSVLLDMNNSGSMFLTVGWQATLSLHLISCLYTGGGLYEFLLPHCWAFHLRSLPLSPKSLSPPRSLVHCRGFPQLPVSWGCLFPFFLMEFRASVLLPHPIPDQVPLFHTLLMNWEQSALKT